MYCYFFVNHKQTSPLRVYTYKVGDCLQTFAVIFVYRYKSHGRCVNRYNTM